MTYERKFFWKIFKPHCSPQRIGKQHKRIPVKQNPHSIGIILYCVDLFMCITVHIRPFSDAQRWQALYFYIQDSTGGSWSERYPLWLLFLSCCDIQSVALSAPTVTVYNALLWFFWIADNEKSPDLQGFFGVIVQKCNSAICTAYLIFLAHRTCLLIYY